MVSFDDVLRPAEFSFFASATCHLSLENLSIRENQSAFSLYLAITKRSFIPNSVGKHNHTFSMKNVSVEGTMILKLFVFKYSGFPVTLLELSFERIALCIFLTKTVK
jgi:hypothetical protein